MQSYWSRMLTDAKLMQNRTINIHRKGRMQERFKQRKKSWKQTMTFVMKRRVENTDIWSFCWRDWFQINRGSDYAVLTTEVRRSFHHWGSRSAVQVAAGKRELSSNKNWKRMMLLWYRENQCSITWRVFSMHLGGSKDFNLNQRNGHSWRRLVVLTLCQVIAWGNSLNSLGPLRSFFHSKVLPYSRVIQ